MIVRIVFLLVVSQGAVIAGEAMVPLLSGQVYLDGRPINQVVQVRLEAANSSLVASTYTFGSARFTFRNIMLVTEENYFLAIRELGFKELRYELQASDFYRDSASAGIRHYGGSVILELESLPKEKKAGDELKKGPKAVDTRQLKTEISGKARHEYNAALESYAAGNNKEALIHLEKSVTLAPEYYDALNKLGGEYVRSRRYREAEGILDRARNLNANDPLPLTNLGILYLRQGDQLHFMATVKDGSGSQEATAFYNRAVEVFDKALRLNSLAPGASFHLGTALYKVGNYAKAEPLLLNALELDNQMHEARLGLINIYTRQRRYDEALKQISKYLELNPGSSQRKKLEELKAQMEGASD